MRSVIKAIYAIVENYEQFRLENRLVSNPKLITLYQNLRSALKKAGITGNDEYPKLAFPGKIVPGQGRANLRPSLYLLDERETKVATHGKYICLVFQTKNPLKIKKLERKGQSNAYLKILFTQGEKDKIKNLDGNKDLAIQKLRENALSVANTYQKELEDAGFEVASPKKDLGIRIASMEFKERKDVTEKRIVNALKALIEVYTRCIDSQEEEKNILTSDSATAEDIWNILSSPETQEGYDKTTDSLTMVNARLGQGRFKQNVKEFWFPTAKNSCCLITGCTENAMLIASHIKPWALCENDKERLMGANGLLLRADIDKLFDRFLITLKVDQKKIRLDFNPVLNKDTQTELNAFNKTMPIKKLLTTLPPQKIGILLKFLETHNKKFSGLNSQI